MPRLLAIGFALLVAAQVVLGFDIKGGDLAEWLLPAGMFVVVVGAVAVARVQRSRVGWAAVVLLVLALATMLCLIGDVAPRLTSIVMPLACAAGVGGLAMLRGGDAAPFAVLAAIGQLIVLPPPEVLEASLERVYEAMGDHHGLLAIVVQAGVAAVTITSTRRRA